MIVWQAVELLGFGNTQHASHQPSSSTACLCALFNAWRACRLCCCKAVVDLCCAFTLEIAGLHGDGTQLLHGTKQQIMHPVV
jgi:hypothetical protein